MIPLSYEHAFSAYLYFWIVAIGVLWFRDALRAMKQAEWSIAKERLYNCGRCHLSFLSKDDSENVTRCPRCNEMCFIRKRKRF